MTQAPFIYFGGKARIASLVWERFGDTANYVDPFAGSLAVLLSRPDDHQWWDRTETVNDLDGNISNFWRSVGNRRNANRRCLSGWRLPDEHESNVGWTCLSLSCERTWLLYGCMRRKDIS